MARINIEQLRTFLTTVRLGSVRKAALGLNITQPAVTARIKNLEQSLAANLFDRTASGLRLTKRGERLISYAEQFEHLTQLVEANITDPQGIDFILRLGVSETVAQCWLPEFVSALHREFPKVEIEINVDISINLRDGLLNREIDLAILLGPVSEYSVNNIELPGFDLAWYAATDMRAEDGNDATLLATKPIITYARNTRPYRELKTALFERVGPGVSLFPSSSLSACFRLVEAGLGVAALPRALGQPYLASGTLREFDPGWTPGPLRFSLSYLGDPKSHVVETAAKIALGVAEAYPNASK